MTLREMYPKFFKFLDRFISKLRPLTPAEFVVGFPAVTIAMSKMNPDYKYCCILFSWYDAGIPDLIAVLALISSAMMGWAIFTNLYEYGAKVSSGGTSSLFFLRKIEMPFVLVKTKNLSPTEMVSGAIASYGLMVVAFALRYELISASDPHSFTIGSLNFTQAFYLSLLTMVTGGCNDISPANDHARSIISCEVSISLIY